jgi:hypothetical protein
MNYQDITIGDLERLRDAEIGDVVDTAAGKVKVYGDRESTCYRCILYKAESGCVDMTRCGYFLPRRFLSYED